MKRIYLLPAVIIFLVFLIPFILSLAVSEVPNDIQPSLEGTQMIDKDITVSQFFVSTMDNLSGIGTSIKNPNFRNHKALIFNLYSEGNNKIRTVNLNGANILDGDFMKIKFTPVNNSKGKKFSFSLSAPDVNSEESLEVFLTSQKPYWIEDLDINSNKSQEKIPFVTYHKNANILSVASTIFIQLFIRLFADLPFALFYILLIGSLIGCLFYIKKKD